MKGDAESGWLADRLGNARVDAERIAHELADKGHLTPDQTAIIVAAVDAAIVRGRELLADALREPRRLLQSLRATTAPDTAHARIDALEARIASLEEALRHAAPRARRGSEGD